MNLDIEKNLKYVNVMGIDEVGRGALAGPLVVGGVILDLDNVPEGINDSKKLSAEKRKELYSKINETCRCVDYEFSDVSEIDHYNISKATSLAIERMIARHKIDYILLDGRIKINTNIPHVSIIKGDTLSPSIAAASIIAKVVRDKHMEELYKEFPKYNWHINKGYYSNQVEVIEKYGITKHHRKSYNPVKTMLKNGVLRYNIKNV